MSAWDFAEAQRRMPLAAAVLARRDEVAALLAPIGIYLPTSLRSAYETADTSVADAQALADAELVAARALVAAETAARAPRDTLVTIGLLGGSPDAGLAAAEAAFRAGSGDAAGRAEAVIALIGGAAAVGRGRVAAGIGGLIVVALMLVLAAFLVRRRRAAMRRAGADAPASYATLPDQSGGRPEEKDPIVISDRQDG
jgi:hypothetical protein